MNIANNYQIHEVQQEWQSRKSRTLHIAVLSLRSRLCRSNWRGFEPAISLYYSGVNNNILSILDFCSHKRWAIIESEICLHNNLPSCEVAWKYVRLCVSLFLRMAGSCTQTVYLCRSNRYQISKRISGPLVDRIDTHIEVPRVDYEKLSGDRVGESSEAIRARVQAA